MKGVISEIVAADWKQILADKNKRIWETEVLPEYLKKMRWFGSKGKRIQNVVIADAAQMRNVDAGILLILVTYPDNSSEQYQLPVAFGTSEEIGSLFSRYPKAQIGTLSVDHRDGFIYDAVYDHKFQRALLESLADDESRATDNPLKFEGSSAIREHVEKGRIESKILAAEQSNTSIIYGDQFFLKLFRKVDNAINPDLEISSFLTSQNFKGIPEFAGSITWNKGEGSIALAMVQRLVPDSKDAWTHFLNELQNIHNKITETSHFKMPDPVGSMSDPVSYEQFPKSVTELITRESADQASMLGVRTAQMHEALYSGADHNSFKPEPLTTADGKKLFEEVSSLIDDTFSNLKNNLNKLSPKLQEESKALMATTDEMRRHFEKIYQQDMHVNKIRVHGDYHLGQVMRAKDDFIITDFEGEPGRPFEERRLKRIALQDVAGMIRSFHYAAYGSVFLNKDIAQQHCETLLMFAEHWYHYMSGLFIKSYLETAKGKAFVPADKSSLEFLLNYFLFAKAIYELNYEINNRPEWVIIPLKGIQSILQSLSLTHK